MLLKNYSLFIRLLIGLSLLMPGYGRTKSASPQIQQFFTSTQVPVYYVAAHELPMIDIQVIIGAGAAQDGKKSGLANLTSSMLDEGASSLSADTISNQLADTGASYDNDTNLDFTSVSLRTLSDAKICDKALQTFLTILTKPNFPAKNFRRIKNSVLQNITEAQQDPDTLASLAFFENLYSHHPYQMPVTGTLESVNSITRADVMQFYKNYYVRKNIKIILVGDINIDAAHAIAERIAEQLPNRQTPAHVLPVPTPLAEGKTIIIRFPTEQATIMQGQIAIARKDPDYYTLYLGNYILGGGEFTARLFNEVREKRGLAYVINSYFMPLAVDGPFVISVKTSNSSVNEILQIIRSTLQKYISAGPTEEEVKAAKDFILKSFPLRTASNSQLSAYLAVIAFYDLPLDYLTQFPEKINAVTKDEITAAFQKHIQPTTMVHVRVEQSAK